MLTTRGVLVTKGNKITIKIAKHTGTKLKRELMFFAVVFSRCCQSNGHTYGESVYLNV